MEFRWIALLTLWTMLIGPIVAIPGTKADSRRAPARSAR